MSYTALLPRLHLLLFSLLLNAGAVLPLAVVCGRACECVGAFHFSSGWIRTHGRISHDPGHSGVGDLDGPSRQYVNGEMGPFTSVYGHWCADNTIHYLEINFITLASARTIEQKILSSVNILE